MESVTMSAPVHSDIENWFTYHKPTETTLPKYEAIREAGKVFALSLMEHCPAGPDRTVAIRKVREAVMMANQAVACS